MTPSEETPRSPDAAEPSAEATDAPAAEAGATPGADAPSAEEAARGQDAASPSSFAEDAPAAESGSAQSDFVESGGVEGEAAPAEPAPVAPPGALEPDGEAGVLPEPGSSDAPGSDAPAPAEAAGAPAAPAPAAAPADTRNASAAVPGVSVLEVRELDWDAVRAAVEAPVDDARAQDLIARMEERLAGGGPLGLAFEEYAAGPNDRAIQVGDDWPLGEVWFVGDLHGDLLALEAALQHIDRSGGGAGARIVFLGDLWDDGVHAPEVALRFLELVLDGPMRVTVVAGNHDAALVHEGGRFQSTVLPSDFTDWLNAQSRAGHPWAARLGRLLIRFFARAPRALFFPDGLLVAHGGVPHTDLHAELEREGNWNDPRVLQDFVWLRAHPRARKRIPNRTTRGSEFGREDFAAFCQVAARVGRPVARMLRGHDHVEERFAVYPAWAEHPALTINTLSHRLPREVFGPYERVPVVARWVRGELPEVRRLFVPPELIRQVYPEPADPAAEEGA